MKRIYYIFCCLMAVAMLTSCNDDTTFNTTDATVSFGEAEYSIKESKGLFKIPVVVTGEQNGHIEVTVSVVADDDKCKEDVHYYVTSKKVVIPEYKKEVYVEIKAIDDRVINEDRHFSLRIENVNGAKIGSTNSVAKITLTDNDDIPYERIAGVWTVTAENLFSESGKDPISWDMNLEIVDDDDPSYGSVVIATPWATADGSIPVFDEAGTTLTHQMTFHHNESTGRTTLDMKLGTTMASDLDFGKIEGIDFSKAYVCSGTEGMAGSSVFSGTLTGVVNEDYTEITFSNPILLGVFPYPGGPYMYYGGYSNITLKLKK